MDAVDTIERSVVTPQPAQKQESSSGQSQVAKELQAYQQTKHEPGAARRFLDKIIHLKQRLRHESSRGAPNNQERLNEYQRQPLGRGRERFNNAAKVAAEMFATKEGRTRLAASINSLPMTFWDGIDDPLMAMGPAAGGVIEWSVRHGEQLFHYAQLAATAASSSGLA